MGQRLATLLPLMAALLVAMGGVVWAAGGQSGAGDEGRYWWESEDPWPVEQAAAGCQVKAAARGDGDWLRGAATVDCSEMIAAEGAVSLAYSLDFGDWVPASAAFAVAAEGVNWVQVQTVAADGTAGLPWTTTVAIDLTPPRVRLAAPTGAVLSHAEQLVLDVTAEDDMSGIALAVADMDAEQEVPLGTPVDLWELPLGHHTLSAWARDYAGNTAEAPERFEVEIRVDVPALGRLVQMFAGRGRLDGYSGLKQKLLTELEKADGGDARSHLAAFVDQVGEGAAQGLIMRDAAAVLTGDATWLMERLGDDQSVEPPSHP